MLSINIFSRWTAAFVFLVAIAAFPPCGQAQSLNRDPFDTVNGLVFTHDSSKLFVGKDTGLIYMLKPPLGARLGPWIHAPKFLSGLSLSPKGDVLAGFRFMRPDVFLLDTAKMPRKYDEDTHPSFETLSTPGLRVGVDSIAFSPDGKWLVADCRRHHDTPQTFTVPEDIRSTMLLWDFPRRKLYREFRGKDICTSNPVFSPDSRTLAACNHGKGKIAFWDVQTDKLLKTISVTNSYIRFSALVYMPGGKQLVSAGKELDHSYHEYGKGPGSVIKIWDVSTGRLLHTLTGHRDQDITALIPLPSEKLISGCNDHTIRLWDIKTSHQIAQVNLGESADCLTLSPDGKFLACEMLLSGIRIWRLSDVFPVQGVEIQRSFTTEPKESKTPGNSGEDGVK